MIKLFLILIFGFIFSQPTDPQHELTVSYFDSTDTTCAGTLWKRINFIANKCGSAGFTRAGGVLIDDYLRIDSATCTSSATVKYGPCLHTRWTWLSCFSGCEPHETTIGQIDECIHINGMVPTTHATNGNAWAGFKGSVYKGIDRYVKVTCESPKPARSLTVVYYDPSDVTCSGNAVKTETILSSTCGGGKNYVTSESGYTGTITDYLEVDCEYSGQSHVLYNPCWFNGWRTCPGSCEDWEIDLGLVGDCINLRTGGSSWMGFGLLNDGSMTSPIDTYVRVECCAFGEFNNGGCSSCDSSCQTCDGGNSNDCTSCTDGDYLSSGSCNSCNGACKTCDGGNSNDCTSCDDGDWLSGSSCVSCTNDCATCTDATHCITCDSSFHYRSSDQTCRSDCGPNCEDCRETDWSYCTACNANNLRYLTNGNCDLCINNCATCSSASNCITCNPTHHYRSSDQSCQAGCAGNCDNCRVTDWAYCTACPDGTYLNNGNCLACDEKCETCNGPSNTDCLSCADYWTGSNCDVCPFDDVDDLCKECANGKGPDSNCACELYFSPPDCLVCINPLQDETSGVNCLDCKNTKKEWPDCVNCEKYWEGATCGNCPSLYNGNCDDCSNTLYDKEDGCGSCLNSRMIYPDCDTCDDYWTSSDCSTCPSEYIQSECKVCDDSNYDPVNSCTTCLDHYSLSSLCTECEEGYDINSNCVNTLKGGNALVFAIAIPSVIVIVIVVVAVLIIGGFIFVKKRKSNIDNLNDDIGEITLDITTVEEKKEVEMKVQPKKELKQPLVKKPRKPMKKPAKPMKKPAIPIQKPKPKPSLPKSKGRPTQKLKQKPSLPKSKGGRPKQKPSLPKSKVGRPKKKPPSRPTQKK